MTKAFPQCSVWLTSPLWSLFDSTEVDMVAAMEVLRPIKKYINKRSSTAAAFTAEIIKVGTHRA